ncbi:hypothetical protein OHA72_58775 [Dactylosporangium sp. NBC_01737]|uniref:hypothetical protein n=1 Tax=Dactylosporangium sp. NBC_01737 TaxID=2975959 RepID=UPI002E0FD231|nr:hypothetical protein OHA72_58775 [Dactylosporangium sp. NBC_01737]
MQDVDSVAMTIASNEYQRRIQQAQAAAGRVDQTPVILGTGLTLMLTAAAAALAVLWPTRTSVFWVFAAILSLSAGLFTVLVLYRDFVARVTLTDAEKAQTRLRNYFVSRAPEVEPYLSDTIYDDWPTPFNNPWRSKTFAAWLVLAAAASIFLGGAVTFAAESAAPRSDAGVFAAGFAVAGLSMWLLTMGLVRMARRRARLDRPLFPRPDPPSPPT